MFRLLKIRQLQFARALNGLGIYVPIVFVAFLGAMYAAYHVFQLEKYSYALTAVIVFAIASLHINRADKKFVKTHLSKIHWQHYFEYAALTLPISIVALLATNWICFLLLQFLLLLIPAIKLNTISTKTHFAFIGKLVPKQNFEWIAGLRKNIFFIVPLYVLALGFCWLRILPFIILWFVSIFVATFYQYCEPLDILRESSAKPSSFLHNKLQKHISLWLVFCLPVFLLSTFMLPEEWIVNLLFIGSTCAYLVFVILFKYSSYQANENLQAQGLIVSLLGIAAVLPFLLPVPLLLSVMYYFKAKKNLSAYLND